MPNKRKRCNRKTNSHNQGYLRYAAEGRRLKNKERKMAAHKKRMDKLVEYSNKRKEALATLIDECNAKFKLGDKASRATYILKRVVGTLSINKLKGLLERNVAGESWFQSRPLTPNLKLILANTGFPKELSEAMWERPVL